MNAVERRPFGAGAVILIVLGALVALVGLGLGAGGGFVVWANETQRDAAGFFTTSTRPFQASGYAITHEGFDVQAPNFANVADLATVRIRAAGDRSLFVGIGRRSAVDAYLRGVAHAEAADISYRPFSVDYVPTAGTKRPAAPATRTFWSASATGRSISLSWPLKQGNWSVVLMNADGSPGVAADVGFGARIRYLGWIATGLSGGGILALALGVLMIALGARRPPAAATETVPGAAPILAGPYPVRIEARLEEPLSRWLWLVKWLLALPHWFLLFFLWIGFGVATLLAFLVLLFTGRYPRGLFDFNVGVLRWSWRVGYYSVSAIGTDRYPPFTLTDVPDYPARLEIAYPEHHRRGLPLIGWWLLGIPQYAIAALLGSGTGFGFNGGHWSPQVPSVVGVLVLVAGVLLLVGRGYPRNVYELIMGFNRWSLRALAYGAFLTPEYPPFRLDQGGEEPTTTGPAPTLGRAA